MKKLTLIVGFGFTGARPKSADVDSIPLVARNETDGGIILGFGSGFLRLPTFFKKVSFPVMR